MMEQIKAAQLKNDPEKRAAYYNSLANLSGNQSGGQQTQAQDPSVIPQAPGREGMQQDMQPGNMSTEQATQVAANVSQRQQPTAQQRAIINVGRGLPAGWEAPGVKDRRTANLKMQETQQTSDVKEATALASELPIIDKHLKTVGQLIKYVKAHKSWFGPGILGYDIHGPSYRKRQINNPDYGEMESGFASLVAPMAQELSNRGLASSLNFAIETKPGFQKNWKIVLGNLNSIQSKLEASKGWKSDRNRAVGGRQRFKDLTYSHKSGGFI